jgi:beta-lactamase class A
MYPHKQLGWAGPAHSRNTAQTGNYAHHSNFLRTPAYRHLVLAAVLFMSILFTGTTEVIKTLATKQIAYQPAATTPITANPEPTTPAVAKPQQPDPQPAPQPAVTPPVTDKSFQVQAVLDSWKAAHSSQQWGVVLQGLGADKTNASVNPNAQFNMASVYKLYLMYPLFKTYSLESLATTKISVSGRGSTNLKACVELMIINSDNPCGEAVGYRLGWGKSATLLKQLGLKGTNLNSQTLASTAADAALFLQKFNDGQLMPAPEQQYITSLMQQQKYRGGIPAGCPGCIVADKTGDLGIVRHDVALVQSAGKNYILAVMTNGAGYAQIAELTRQVQAAMAG